MGKEERILVAAREGMPTTYLYTKIIKRDSAEPRPVILLVPGGPGGNHSVFSAIEERLLAYADLVLFDPRGCGYSDPSEAECCTLNHYIDDIEEVRRHFNLDQFVLLGGSYGAMACAGYAIKFPEHLGKLILLAGAPSGKFIETAKANLEEKGSPEQKIAAEKLWEGRFESPDEFAEYYRVMRSLYFFKPPREIPATQSGIPYNIEVNNLGFRSFLRTFNFEDRLHEIQCPTLLICGAQDWINDPRYARIMARQIPHSVLNIFQECGHFVWGDQPELFFKAMGDFLAQTKAHALVCAM